jgi:tetratricopeptide (TPR) repeat protein
MDARVHATGRACRACRRCAGTLAGLCNTLDRLPLGIELAASLAGVVSAAELVPMLEKSALDLKTRRQDVDDRQRSLRAAIDWSYELLTESERRLFRRLAVFEGGWTLQMAAAVVDGGGAVDLAFADAMGSLLDKHLIRKASGERFEMLGTLHQYAAEQLGKDAGEAEEMRRRHAAYFVKVGEVARAGGGAASVATRLQQLEVEQDNLTTALTALVDRGELSGALRLGVTLGRFWWARNYAEGYRRLDVLRQLPAAPPLRSLRAEMLLERGRLAIRLARLEDAAAAFAEALALAEAEGDARLEARALADAALVPMERADFAAARPRLERALELRRAGRDPGEIADSLDSLGVVATGTGDYGAATAFLEESLIHYRMAGDAQGEAWVLNDMARVALATDDPGTAHDRAAAALAIGRDLSDWGLTAWARNYLGLVASRRGAHDEAREHHVESLRLVRLLGDARPIALAIEGFAALAAEQERWERAVQLASAAESVRVAFEIRRTVADEAILDLRLRGAKAALTAAELERATAAGRAMSLDQAAALAGE